METGSTNAAAGRAGLLRGWPATGGGLSARQQTFTDALGKKLSSPGEAPGPEARARATAEDFVAVALVQPILKQLRESNQAAAPFAPGEVEKQFRGLADAQVARQVVKASSFPLVDRLAGDLLRRPAGLPTR